jgi:hypothetical protein
MFGRKIKPSSKLASIFLPAIFLLTIFPPASFSTDHSFAFSRT